MPAQLSLSAAKITKLTDEGGGGELLTRQGVTFDAAQIVVRGDVAGVVQNRQRIEISGVTSIESPRKGVWLMAAADGLYQVERLAGRCCGRR